MIPQETIVRRMPLIVLLAGVILLAAGLLTTAGSLAQQRQQDKALQRDAAQVSAAFTSYFERARSLDLLLAQNPAVRPRGVAGSAGVSKTVNAQANRALGYLEHLYPGAIGEACLINERGVELARVTLGIPAPISDLSSNEATNPFFAPTMALKPGKVYQAAPYVSTDTQGWVISNSTLVERPAGGSLLVHFEVSLESFQQFLATSSTSLHVAVVDQRSGHTLLTNNADLPAADAEFPLSPYRDVLGSGSTEPRSVQVDGERLAVSSVSDNADNANHWAIVQWSTRDASLLPPWAGGVGTAAGIALIMFFVIASRRQHTALRMAARLDHLTGMANRKALEEAMDKAVVVAASDGERVGILMLDLDGFKQINDTLGHDRGDLVLQEIARRLHANTFEYDTAARMGGDEFAVVLRRLHATDDVATVAHRLRETLVRPIYIDGMPRFVGVSIGAAVYADHGMTAADLLRAADAAMYRAKRGHEGVRVYDSGTSLGAHESWLAAELLLAIENDEITMVYQPEQALDTGRIVGVEALARWTRPGGRDITPSEFVPLAEQTGLIRQLTHLTLRKALDETKVWHDAGALVPVSVNLSAILATDRTLPAVVGLVLAERGLTGAALVLEITETAVIEDISVACEVLAELRSMGIRIELDDFGNGYASIKGLLEMPLDGIKIDRDLVNDVSPGAQQLLAAAIDMGKALRLYVVAEGIEDQTALDAVRLLGADIVQGYHLGRPMSSEDVLLTITSADARLPVQPTATLHHSAHS
jgi:diguanylate cyclase (GGDEF)-like protein